MDSDGVALYSQIKEVYAWNICMFNFEITIAANCSTPPNSYIFLWPMCSQGDIALIL